MKKLLVLFAAVVLAAPAFALPPGIDLAAGGACPGDGGLLDGGPLDCAGGAPAIVYSVFTPAEAIPDLSAYDATYDVGVGGDLHSTATFWNQDAASGGCMPPPLFVVSGSKPASGCSTPTNYSNVFTGVAGAAASVLSPNHEVIGISAARAGTFSATTNSRIFGHSLVWDGGMSTDAGGNCTGCALPVCIVSNDGFPRSAGAVQPTALHASSGSYSGIGNQAFFNGGGSLCGAVPTKKHTWGQLKSLYRR